MLAIFALSSILDTFGNSLGPVLKTSCSATETIANGLACIACGGRDCIANASAGSTSYTTCAELELSAIMALQNFRADMRRDRMSQRLVLTNGACQSAGDIAECACNELDTTRYS